MAATGKHRKVTAVTAFAVAAQLVLLCEVDPQDCVGALTRILRGYLERYMRVEDPAPQPPQFTRKSESESVCLSCMSTIRSDRCTPLDVAEDIHSDVCLVKPSSPVRYAYL